LKKGTAHKDKECYLNNTLATRHGSGLQKESMLTPIQGARGVRGEQSCSWEEAMMGKGPELLVLGHSEKPLAG